MHYSKSKAIENALALLICLAILLVFSRHIHAGWNTALPRVSNVSDSWYYIQDGRKIEVSLPASISLDPGEDLTLYCNGLTQENALQVLTTRGAVYRLKILLGDQVLYQYDDASFPRNEQMASKVNCTATLPNHFSGETVSFTYTDSADGVYDIAKVYVGTSDAVVFYHCSRDAFTLITVFIMAVLGVLTVCISLYLRYMHVSEKRFGDIACFLLFCVFWFLTDSSLAQMISGSSPVIRYISFYAFMMLAVPMLHFIQNTENMKNCHIIDIIIHFFYGNAILQSFLNYFDLFDFVDMLFLTHILLFAGIVVLMTLLIGAYRKNGDKELYTILVSFGVLAGGGVLSLISYWLFEISSYEVFFELGIVVFIILLIRVLIVTMVQNLKFKTESIVYQRLAKEDQLTGMKNRRAFDEMLTKIEENITSYRNLFLVFMDLNCLKKVNDTLGHHVGDELIIAAAQCVEKAFGPYGSCFRIGGDEFCAIMPDIALSEQQLSEMLDKEIRLYNHTCTKYQISIARGISNLRDSAGNLKTVSDWKQEADMKMYQNKGWIKRIE